MRFTRRDFAKAAAALLPWGFLRAGGADGGVGQPGAPPIGVLPRGVDRVPETPFDAPAGSWSMVAIPDSQHDTAFYPEVFERQMQWIAAHRSRHDIRFVMHEGDITEDNLPRQWTRVRKGFDALRAAGVPFSLTTGNHDFEPVNRQIVSRDTKLNDYFKPEDYAASASFGLAAADRVENSWHEVDSPWGKILVLSLEFGPPLEILSWARGVIAERRPQRTILVTHGYLAQDGSRYDFDAKGTSQSASPRSYAIPGITDGEIVWRELVQHEDSIRLVLCGHSIGSGGAYLPCRNLHGSVCHQVHANYQMQVRPARGHGSGGFLLLLQFMSDGRTVALRTYSPWYNLWLDGPAQRFEIDFA
jgi:hypothetical protein